MALMANDACGAPLPSQMCLPWLFFDGKLFHSKLLKACRARNLAELCDGRMEMVYRIERMRAAITFGVVKPDIGPIQPGVLGNPGGFGRPHQPRGHLMVAGSVVSSWGNQPHFQHHKNQQKKKKNKVSLECFKYYVPYAYIWLFQNKKSKQKPDLEAAGQGQKGEAEGNGDGEADVVVEAVATEE